MIEIEFQFEIRFKLVLEFQKIENNDKTKYDTFYSHSIAEAIINKIDFDNSFESIDTTVISIMQKLKGSGWIIDSCLDHNINIQSVTKQLTITLVFI